MEKASFTNISTRHGRKRTDVRCKQFQAAAIVHTGCHGLLEIWNKTEPSFGLLVMLVLFPLWRIKMSVVKKVYCNLSRVHFRDTSHHCFDIPAGIRDV